MTGAGKARVQQEYAALAANYDRRWRVYLDRSLEATLARLSLGGTESILDLGCGSGELLRRLRERYPQTRLTGADLSPAMLAVARAKLGAQASLVCAAAGTLPFPDNAFDVMLSTSMLHYLPAPEVALDDIRRVLRPGGSLVLTDWCGDFLSVRMLVLWLRLTRRPLARLYRGDECRQMLKRTGFRVLRLERYRTSWLWGLMTVTAEK